MHLYDIIFDKIDNNYVIKIVTLNWYICSWNVIDKINSNTAQKRQNKDKTNTIKNAINTK